MPTGAHRRDVSWYQIAILQARTYRCGYCDKTVGPDKGWQDTNAPERRIYVCSYCGNPTFFQAEEQTPGVAYGGDVSSLPDDLEKLYREARGCTSQAAYTSAVLSCRKILMHVAVDMGAAENLKFIEYVDYLHANHYIPPNSKGWVDKIRQKGNFANHEIRLMTKEDAEEMISFVEMLLKIMYEFPKRAAPTSP